MGFVYFSFTFFSRSASQLLVVRGLEPYLFVSFFLFLVVLLNGVVAGGLKPFCVRYIFHFKLDNYKVVGGLSALMCPRVWGGTRRKIIN